MGKMSLAQDAANELTGVGRNNLYEEETSVPSERNRCCESLLDLSRIATSPAEITAKMWRACFGEEGVGRRACGPASSPAEGKKHRGRRLNSHLSQA